MVLNKFQTLGFSWFNFECLNYVEILLKSLFECIRRQMWRIEKFIHQIDVNVCVNDRNKVLNGKTERVYVIILCGKKILCIISHMEWNPCEKKRNDGEEGKREYSFFLLFI